SERERPQVPLDATFHYRVMAKLDDAVSSSAVWRPISRMGLVGHPVFSRTALHPFYILETYHWDTFFFAQIRQYLINQIKRCLAGFWVP
ncbi:MAG: hypothetical protein Q7N95_10030, partial [Alphaproteobacteria bacterium]|nr:hypothetical protein [Alphaproteobacteria bacterium]